MKILSITHDYPPTVERLPVATDCVACGQSQWVPFLSSCDFTGAVQGTFDYVRCCGCGVIRMDPLPDEATVASWYPHDYPCHRGASSLTRRIQSWLRRKEARRIARYAKATGNLLEIGCGIGEFLNILSCSGWSVVGIEPNRDAVEMGRQTFGLDIRQGTLRPGLFGAAQFDCVVMQQVLEHVASPSSLLEEIRWILRPGGLLFVSTPNFDSLDRAVFGHHWHGYEIPRHVFVYGATNLTALLQRHGFEILTVRHRAVPNDYVWSIRYICLARPALRWAAGFFRVTNPLTWPIFFPVAALGALMRRSGRIEVLAGRPSGEVSP